VKWLGLGLVALAIVRALTGGRWDSIVGDAGVAIAVLIVAWLVLTHLVSKLLERRTEKVTRA
jgi:hypothetical protein